uniref:CxC2-like cysteine cluster KDZ transposase-associated domain-containing protein n=2 Tax=Clytia hemisphaerica TaxID=252671 RepID=A0A7M5X4I7_9CNID
MKEVINNEMRLEEAGFSQDLEDIADPIILPNLITMAPNKRYETFKAKEHCRWDERNTDFVEMFLQKYNDFFPSKCCLCEASLIESCGWCQSCGPSTIYCQDCASRIHENIHFHYLTEVTASGSFQEFKVLSNLKTQHHRYCTNEPYSRLLTVISENGAYHQCKIHFCHCKDKDELDTLLSLDLWPVTPIKPNTVISINLLHLFVALQMEGKISFNSFCEGLAWKTGVINSNLKKYLNRMTQTDCIDQFRNFRRQLVNLKSMCKGYSGLEECASCPKENGSVFYSLDANFGLVLKTSSSKSKRLASRSEDLFIPDEEISNYMDSYDDSIKTKECSNFQAGSNLRSKRKTNKLSVTGIFGASCRHEFPKVFLNMRHGERLGYAVFILDRFLRETVDRNLDVHVVYDIACVLKS